jgi:hypothetical protein
VITGCLRCRIDPDTLAEFEEYADDPCSGSVAWHDTKGLPAVDSGDVARAS